MEGMRLDSLPPPSSNASLKKNGGLKVLKSWNAQVLNLEDIYMQQEWFYLSIIYAQILKNTDWISLFHQVSDKSSANSSSQLPVILNDSSATGTVSGGGFPALEINPIIATPPRRIRVPPCPPPPKTDPIPEEKKKEKTTKKKEEANPDLYHTLDC